MGFLRHRKITDIDFGLPEFDDTPRVEAKPAHTETPLGLTDKTFAQIEGEVVEGYQDGYSDLKPLRATRGNFLRRLICKRNTDYDAQL